MKLNEINEIGFYKELYDKKPDYIFEVIENTDEEWLKDEPEQNLLIDEWLFDYVDNDDRFHYGCAGNLVAVENADDIEVVKITDKKEQKHFSFGDIMEIKDGHFYFSDYEQGIYEYNEKDEKYHSHFHCNESEGDKIIGFRNLKLDTREIIESFMENILLKYLESDITTHPTESEGK